MITAVLRQVKAMMIPIATFFILLKTKDNIFTFQNLYIKVYSDVSNIFCLKTKMVSMCKISVQNIKKSLIGSKRFTNMGN